LIFTESNTVEQMILDALSSHNSGSGGALVLREDPPGCGDSLDIEYLRRHLTSILTQGAL
jgi:hypothetical protein